MLKQERYKNFKYSHSEFLEMMDYNDETGQLSWKITKQGPKRSKSLPITYIKFKIDKIHYFAHELVWFYHYGKWPSSDVLDHIDRDIYNNRIENLREATFTENSNNKSRRGETGKIEENIFRKRNNFIVRYTIEKEFSSLEEAKAWKKRIIFELS